MRTSIKFMLIGIAISTTPARAVDKEYCKEPMQVFSDVYITMTECDYPEHLRGAYNRRNLPHDTIIAAAQCMGNTTEAEFVAYAKVAKEKLNRKFNLYGKSATCSSVGM